MRISHHLSLKKHFLCWNISFQKRKLRYVSINRFSLLKNGTKYSKSQQSTGAEVGHFLYFHCNRDSKAIYCLVKNFYVCFISWHILTRNIKLSAILDMCRYAWYVTIGITQFYFLTKQWLICAHNRTYSECFGFQHGLKRFQTIYCLLQNFYICFISWHILTRNINLSAILDMLTDCSKLVPAWNKQTLRFFPCRWYSIFLIFNFFRYYGRW